MELFAAAKKIGFAIPAVNVTSSSTANAVMEAAALVNSPIVIQVLTYVACFVCNKCKVSQSRLRIYDADVV